MNSTITRIRSVGTAIGLTYGSIIAGNLVILIAIIIFSELGISVTSNPSLQLLLSTVLLQGVTFGGIALLYVKVRGLELDFVPFSVPSRRDAAVIVAGIFVLLGVLVVTSLVLSSLGIESAENQVVTVGEQNPEVFLLLIPLSFLLVGPGEELLFRGLVQGVLRETLRPSRAIVLASALFASIHLFALTGEGKLVYIAVAFALAIILGATYEYTDNLAVPALIHGAYNAVQFAGAYLTATGGM
jgi:membrane protease YdiL (CAAX protease family)